MNGIVRLGSAGLVSPGLGSVGLVLKASGVQVWVSRSGSEGLVLRDWRLQD
jgi:hypothetical protein